MLQSTRPSRMSTKCQAQAHSDHPSRPLPPRQDRRQLLASLAATSVLLTQRDAFAAADATSVGSYLPASGVGDLVTYFPDAAKTPALRAGVIRPEERYQFNLPPNFKESRISNTQSGNFCMPRCAEPWTEVVFEDAKLGKVQLMAVPLLKLTNAKNAKLADLGAPDQLLTRIGPYLTGSYFDEDSVQGITTQQHDGLDYYEFELYALDAPNQHSLTAVAAKGEVVYLFVVSASDKQWKQSEKTLRTVMSSFRA